MKWISVLVQQKSEFLACRRLRKVNEGIRCLRVKCHGSQHLWKLAQEQVWATGLLLSRHEVPLCCTLSLASTTYVFAVWRQGSPRETVVHIANWDSCTFMHYMWGRNEFSHLFCAFILFHTPLTPFHLNHMDQTMSVSSKALNTPRSEPNHTFEGEGLLVILSQSFCPHSIGWS